ncbi:unnamed protein product [Didymodactylos carnosus]|uniref:Uncharacterized protein n=1 Tax=Didymodactylos carnosus TaxID=1234261 RepID=A0A8S2HH68_9BILA|nr:unnamed protein product [Didymodactylos carnosus]CAF3642021.1 unnamed protein product [Didymodactylos carnosus]
MDMECVEKLSSVPRDLYITDSDVVFCVGDNILYIIGQEENVIVIPLQYEATSIAIHPHPSKLAVGGNNKKVHVYKFDGIALTEIHTLEHDDFVVKVA